MKGKKHPNQMGNDITERALGYPYDIPSHSYLIDGEEIKPWDHALDLTNRIPVLACGSNQSPTQLLRKFGPTYLPVMAGWLHDYDSVYSAHFTKYGSIAATYHYEKGIRSRQMITWLNHEQLDGMHKTESLGINYEFVELDHIHFHSDCGEIINNSYNYNSSLGTFKINSLPIGLQTIEAQNRPYPSLTQKELQESVLKAMNYPHCLKQFIEETVKNDKLRAKRRHWLIKTSGT
ncbi:hypothetical protein [Terasakiella sp. SH-1]|uniref:hypothetical protein n=1 Tax=Terasakiella sp. SH-1 TaxID=2560057 RepID=UPI001073EAAF|nr:hypothetical protein [Terasakiella sp. SH-1]